MKDGLESQNTKQIKVKTLADSHHHSDLQILLDETIDECELFAGRSEI